MGVSRLYLLGISMFVKLVWIGLFWYHCFELQPHWITKNAIYLWWGKLACLFELCWLYLAESTFLSQGFSLHISVGGVKARADSPDLQSWLFFLHLSALEMDLVIMLGEFSALHALYPFLCTNLNAKPSPLRSWRELSIRALSPRLWTTELSRIWISHM